MADPVVSVIMANYNGAMFLPEALRSLMQQSLREIEVLVVDDGSSDDSLAIVQAAAEADSRINLIALSSNLGPAGARNRALEQARGRWVAVMDSDDIMHPERLSGLVAAAERQGADIVADDCLVFDQQRARPPTSLLRRYGRRGRWIDLPEFIRRNELFGRGPALGYLKPLFRREAIERLGLRYDERLRVAEDYDFVARLMLGGSRFYLDPTIRYFYRKHSDSISHRLKLHHVEEMLRADDRFRSAAQAPALPLTKALDVRRRSLQRTKAFIEIVAALKRSAFGEAFSLGLRNPGALPLLRHPVAAKAKAVAQRVLPNSDRSETAPDARRVYIISRQRVVGNTDGGSAYLVSICRTLRDQGFEVHLIAPISAVFDRRPVLRLGPEMDVFASIRFRGFLRAGSFAVRDPRVIVKAGLALAERIFARMAEKADRPDSSAPHSGAVTWTREDEIYLARTASRPARLLVADDPFLTPGFPFCLQPDARTAVVMHDLFSSRTGRLQTLGATDSVAVPDKAEMQLLGAAQAILAIRPDEARIVKRQLPDREVILAPMAIEAGAAPQPGSGRTLLFVGSNTAPNVLGLRWFLDDVWPLIRKADPDAILQVAGSVCHIVGSSMAGVHRLGLVTDLDAAYRDAAVVICPFQVGSGLTMKLIEALGQGKAIVATSNTVEGVEADVADAVVVADEADGFADAVLELLNDSELRRSRCQEALATANRHFTAAARYRDLLRFADGSLQPSMDAPADSWLLAAGAD